MYIFTAFTFATYFEIIYNYDDHIIIIRKKQAKNFSLYKYEVR